MAGLVYVAAFAPDENESVQQIVNRYPPAEVSKYMRRGRGGEWKSVGDAAYLGGDRLGRAAGAAGRDHERAP